MQNAKKPAKKHFFGVSDYAEIFFVPFSAHLIHVPLFSTKSDFNHSKVMSNWSFKSILSIFRVLVCFSGIFWYGLKERSKSYTWVVEINVQHYLNVRYREIEKKRDLTIRPVKNRQWFFLVWILESVGWENHFGGRNSILP